MIYLRVGGLQASKKIQQTQRQDRLASEKEGRMIQPSLVLDRKAELGTGVQPFFEFERIFQYLKENTLTLSRKYFIIELHQGDNVWKRR
ncbi:MAG: hypothetical protein KAT86_00965 [Candidatus Latescibacteria bacterium]|nr:hypothetical protein [Candidatus Latescibacterota bacterium]